MTVVDDARLLELAARRPKDVFPILERAASLSPLVVVLIVLPGVVALQSATLSEPDAQWRLKGLELSTVPSIFDAVDPAATSSVTAIKFQPPLGSWLIAAADRWLPFDANSVPLLEYLSAACLVPACFFLMSRLAGRRVGFLAAALAAFHGTFLQQYRHAGPQALAVAAATRRVLGLFGPHLAGDGDRFDRPFNRRPCPRRVPVGGRPAGFRRGRCAAVGLAGADRPAH